MIVPRGYVVLADSTRSLLVDSPCVSIDMLFVHPDFRRQGIGRSLLSSASRYADRQGCEHLASAVPAGDRDANRFFARLGFAPETVRRVASSGDAPAQAGGEPRPRSGCRSTCSSVGATCGLGRGRRGTTRRSPADRLSGSSVLAVRPRGPRRAAGR